jgi:hypothetical protein
MPLRWWLEPAVAVARHPGLWGTALRQVGRLAAPGWWRRPPFLPLPSAAYLRFRLETAYGEQRAPAPDDLLAYLRWLKHARG